jgi:hypothetical protein
MKGNKWTKPMIKMGNIIKDNDIDVIMNAIYE